MEDGQGRALRRALTALGPLRIFTPDRPAMGLLPPRHDGTGFAVTAIRADARRAARIQVAAIGPHGETLSDTRAGFPGRATIARQAHITLPLEVRNQTARLAIQAKTRPAPCSFWIPADRNAGSDWSRRRRRKTSSRYCPMSIIWSAH